MTTEKNYDNSESMSTPNTKINQAVGREGGEEELGSDRNDKFLCSVVPLLFYLLLFDLYYILMLKLLQ